MSNITLLRPEARPCEESILDHEQSNAVERILQMLDAAIGMVEKNTTDRRGEAERSTIWELDLDRASRIVFLSGERGTGKTTVMVTMMRDCRLAREGGLTAAAKDEDEVRRNELLRRVADRTIWLEPLDMEILPGPTVLLAAILARVENAVRRVHGQKASSERTRHGLIDEEREYDPLLDLRRLQRDVAISWEGNLAARSGNLDPDSFAVEVQRVERSRLSLSKNFGAALDAVSRLFSGPAPLFVLPVDDFDLNPARGLEMLRFLRAISVPRLFTFVLGDTRVAEMIINLRFSGELTELAGRAASSSLLPVPAEDVRAMSGRLASQINRKLIPPGQVIQLRSMTIPEALNYAPPVGGNVGREESLFELLRDCRVTLDTGQVPDKFLAGPRVANLADFLFIQLPDRPVSPGAPTQTRPNSTPESPPPWVRQPVPGLPADVNDPKKRIAWLKDTVSDRGVYQARRVLQTTPRRVVDFSLRLEEINATSTPQAKEPETRSAGATDVAAPRAEGRAEPRPSALLDILGQNYRSRINEDVNLTCTVRQQLNQGLIQDPEGAWTIETEDYIVEPQTSLGESLSFVYKAGEPQKSTSGADEMSGADEESDDDPLTTPYQIYARPARSWVVRAGRSADKPAGSNQATPPPKPPRLEDGTAELFMLFQDLLNLTTPQVTPPTPLMRTTPEVRRWAVSEWRNDYASRVELTWPTPPWSTFWEYDLFLGLWNKFLDGLPTGSKSTNDALLVQRLFAWVDTATAVLAWEAPVGLPGASEPNWADLVRRLEKLTDMPDLPAARAGVVRGWLISVACLLMPEMIGTRPDITHHFASSKRLKDFWDSSATEIRLAREGTYAQFELVKMDALAKHFRSLVPKGFPRSLKPRSPKARRNRSGGFDLRLMSSLNDVSGIPTEGKDLIIVAAVNNVLHFRIFDGDGKVVVDTDEKRLAERARQIEDLRKQLESLWPPHELTKSDKHRVITAVTSIVDHTRSGAS